MFLFASCSLCDFGQVAQFSISSLSIHGMEAMEELSKNAIRKTYSKSSICVAVIIRYWLIK